MIVSVDITEKSFGAMVLYTELDFEVDAGEKVALIGRNGTGKSTLLHMITGEDKDYQGRIDMKSGIITVSSRQEHHGFEDLKVLDYIQGDLPEFAQLHHVISTYPEHMGSDTRKLQRYSDALERFSQLGYFQTEDELTQIFEAYQIDPTKLEATMSELSGGQKRMVELVKVQRSRGHLALIDEPTNHMDYVAKQAFVSWLKAAQEAVLVITHDRDVLGMVDKIIEIRNGRAYTFKGDYAHYLSVNKNQITSQVNEYGLVQRRIKNLGEDIIRFRRLKERSRDPGTIKRFKSQEEKAVREQQQLSKIEKPSFWIDRDNAEDLSPKLSAAYDKYKARNIHVNTKSQTDGSSRLLVECRSVSLGYDDKPLFSDISFSLREGERIRLHGRNGAGKTTLVNSIMAKAGNQSEPAQRFAGTIAVDRDLAIGLYEQEINPKYLPMTLQEAIEASCVEKDVPVSDQKVKQLLGEYLFNPATDGETPVERLSGGQKSRFQLIRMLLNQPRLLILDEPTNHLDLPSIEELEDAMARYSGAVIYISHDSYFAGKLGGTTIQIGQ